MIVIAEETSFEGDVTALGKVVLAGWCEGSIVCDRLEVEEGGFLLGDAVADVVVVRGQVVGDITARRVEVHDTGWIEGTVSFEKLRKDEGSTMVGACKRVDKAVMPDAFHRLDARARARREELTATFRETLERGAEIAVQEYAKYEEFKARYELRLAGGG